MKNYFLVKLYSVVENSVIIEIKKIKPYAENQAIGHIV